MPKWGKRGSQKSVKLLTSSMDGSIGDNLRYARACSRNGNHRTMTVIFHSEIFTQFCVNASFSGQNSGFYAQHSALVKVSFN